MKKALETSKIGTTNNENMIDTNKIISDAWSSKITEGHIKKSGLKKEELEEVIHVFFRRANEKYLRVMDQSKELDTISDFIQFTSSRAEKEIKVRGYKVESANEGMFAVETCMQDQRFIIDTIKLCINEFDVKEEGGVHLTIPIFRDMKGKLLSITKKEDQKHKLESITRFIFTGFQDETHENLFLETLHSKLSMAADVVGDYDKVVELLLEKAKSYEKLANANLDGGPSTSLLHDANEVLTWLTDNNFIYFSCSNFESKGKEISLVESKYLGVNNSIFIKNSEILSQANHFFQSAPNNNQIFHLRKAPIQSPIKRAGVLEMLMLRTFDANGHTVGVTVLVGMFTRKATTLLRSSIPYLKNRLQAIILEDEARPQSSTYNARVKAFNSVMISYLFESDNKQLRRIIDSRLDIESRTEPLAHVDIILERQSAYALICIPHDAFSDNLVEEIKVLLNQELTTEHIQVEIEAAKEQIIPIAFYCTGCSTLDKLAESEIESKIINICTPWNSRFRAELITSGISDWSKLYSKYSEAFTLSYKLRVPINETIIDVLNIEALQKNGLPRFDFLPGAGEKPENEVRLQLYRSNVGGLLLSQILPIFHNLGFRVLDEIPNIVTLTSNTNFRVDTFRLLLDHEAGEQNYIAIKKALIQGLEAIFEGKIQSDSLNRLMLRPGLSWIEVDILRSYLRYSVQIGPFFDAGLVDKVFTKHANLTQALITVFHVKFNPELSESKSANRIEEIAKARLIFLAGIEKIQDATEDKIFRVFFNLIEATVRTNAYCLGKPFHYLSFKFACATLENCPEPRPLYEIFVHHAEMEGCHLRSGLVARGGLRWSDRLDDYRTEIFGLMRAQKSKNVLIVPQGAKGGFVVKGNPKAGQDRKAYGDEMYKVLIRGMLDITDNQLNEKEIRPANVVCHDNFDPYLVVAADKGTAHLSDTANALSAEYGFWLGDAFASGGSVGYDHKVEGITAKGAWVCVRHHFGKIGIDPEKDVITVVGIGDMSGDVFGNGMLRSKTIKLVAAFNHAHVFLDPNPDCDSSFKERQRMFTLPRSGWADYDAKFISKGGGVYSRAEKAITLSLEVQKLLNTSETALSPEEVIKKLLSLKVDLLYNGGLGTYIKSSKEDHREVGDKTNDSVRVDGNKVMATVVGEGGNLGVTQKGRIEFALKGGLIDTDAIDNSGGVDCSDREVNLKILFGPLINQGKMKIEERNKVLKAATNEVLEKILDDSHGHALCLSLDEIRSKKDPFLFVWTTEFLSEKGVMVPEREDLPFLKDLQQRGIQNGFTRPELSKLMAFFKMYTKEQLLPLDASRFPLKGEFLENYFPKIIYKTYGENINSHMLLKELLATCWIGHIINNAGASLFTDLITDSERNVQDVAMSYTATERWIGAHELRKKILDCKEAPLDARLHGVVALEDRIKVAASWVLHFFAGEKLYQKIGTGQDFTETALKFRDAFDETHKFFQSDTQTETKDRLEKEIKELEARGFPFLLAKEMAYSNHWPKAFPIAYLVEKLGKSTKETADAYLRCGQATGMQDILAKISVQSSIDKWEAQALKSLFVSLRRTNLLLTEKALGIGILETLKREPALTQVGKEISKLNANPSETVPVPLLVVMAEKLHKAVARL